MDDRMVVTPEVMESVIAEIDTLKPGNPPPALMPEGLLRSFIEESVLKIAGRLTLCGAAPRLVKTVSHEVDHLLMICVSAIHEGNRRLLDQLLPDINVQKSQCSDNAGDASEDDA
jgi:hypothetical protein